MSGTIYDEIKKNGDSKKREKLKFFLSLMSTNLLVAVICLNANSNPVDSKDLKKTPKLIHPQHKMIVIPLTVLIDLDPKALEIPVSLMTKSKKILIARAYLHEEVQRKDNPEMKGRFKIEIAESDLLALSADSEIEMIAIPELKAKLTAKPAPKKRVSHYEVDL